ncbi:MAG: two-component system sensor histidine kinase NtrB [Longimicrobiales bacterium]
MVHPLRMLRWLYVGRLTLAVGIFGGAVGAWLRTSPETTLLATLTLLSSLGITFGSLWYTHVLRRPPGRSFLYAQILFDTLLVTVVVHITNDGGSYFAPLYILVIAAGALLLPLAGGMLIGALASMLYLADLILWQEPHSGAVVEVFGLRVPVDWVSVGLQVVVFAIMALVTGALGDRLRRTGTALGAVESELRQLRLHTDDILEAIDTGLVTVDASGRLAYMNDAAERVLGLAGREWRARPVLDELDRRAPGLGAVLKRTASLRLPIRRYEIRMAASEIEGDRYLGVRTTVLERKDSLPWVTAVFQDITDTKQIEDLMRRAERLQAVAELGASLAHEIKNPLASIRSAVEQLAAGRLGGRDATVLKGLVLKESDRLTRLLSDFMEFSRLELRRWGSVDLCKITRDAIGLVEQHPDAASRASINLQLPTEPVVVAGDEDLLHRAVFNLVLNAVQHTGRDGKVTVELGRVAKRDMPSTVALERPVRLAVSDTGPGIAPEAVGRIFDPFFTTRKGGTGLGLALVHRAVEAHQGMILVDGGPFHGAQFTVYLPAQAERRLV